MGANLTGQVRSIAEVATAVTKGDLSRSISVEASGEMASLKDNINEMIRNLKDQTLKNAEQDWLKTNLARFSRMLQGERDLATVSRLIMSELAPLVNAQYGVFYISAREEDDTYLELASSYGAEAAGAVKQRLELREGLVGQAAADKRPLLLQDVPSDFVKISSGLGHAKPTNVIILPALFEDDVKAVIELASLSTFSDTHQSFLDQLMESIGIVLNTIAATMRTEGLLKQSQLLTAELQSRQAELTTKQEELHATNEELQEKAQLLENEKKQVENKNLEIEMARRALEEKAEQLALTSKYKSEFLANMSHELRTPLNSLLILSNVLASNQKGNLNDKQVEFAHTIHAAGTDLLNLINDILDLSKIESGTVSIDVSDIALVQLRQHLERTFRQLASDKGLEFNIEVDPDLPETLRTDEKRLQQIVLNLLSNAFKFTSSGGVTVRFDRVSGGNGWGNTMECLAISVRDSGIGIPQDKQKLIFEAFQQADGTTSRKYGGTGLGLSISREIARLLEGELHVESEPGKGSTFTLTIPLQGPHQSQAAAPVRDAERAAAPVASEPVQELDDDRNTIGINDRVVLIVEDDPTFGTVLLGLAREAGLKAVVSAAGSGTLALARKLMPDAITLDLGLSDIDGGVLFDLLRHDPKTSSLPIHVISGSRDTDTLLDKGAASVGVKPVAPVELRRVFNSIRERPAQFQRSVLVCEADADRRINLAETIRDRRTKVTSVSRLAANADQWRDYDVIVLGLGGSSKENLKIFKEAVTDPEIRQRLIVCCAAAEQLNSAIARLPEGKDVTVVQNPAELPAILGAQAAGPTEEEETGIESVAGAKVLIVDDDIRNIFTLTSVLESWDIEVLHAERGAEGIEILETMPDIDVALIDIMMPEMDGYETMQQIKRRAAIADIPLISVTAKAMKGDRQKCIDAGASDYISKPVDLDLLLALLRVWVSRSRTRRQGAQPVASTATIH
jgi:signal transduction histidine kinase/DNA-binding response OmpR family regulator/HAMP domain-containing protein